MIIEAQAEKWQGCVTPPQTSVVAPALEQVGNEADVQQDSPMKSGFGRLATMQAQEVPLQPNCYQTPERG